MITEIGKIRIRWNLDSPTILRRLKGHYKDYIVSRGRPHLIINVKSKSTPAISPGKRQIILSTRSWDYFKMDDIYYLYFKGSKSLAEIPADFRYVNIFLSNRSAQLLLYLFPEVLYSLILPKFNGLLLHACGVKVRERIFVFCAPPEGGKSTIAKLALEKGYQLLNDDRIILRNIKDKYYAFGNPWHGEVEITSPGGGEIYGLFFLRKDNKNCVQKIDKKEMFVQILSDSFYVREERRDFQKVIEIIGEMVNNIKGYVLGFKPDIKIWEYLNGEEFVK